MLQTTKPRVVLLGLEEALSAELGAVLPAQKYSLIPERFSSPAECLRTIERTGADLVFCAAESNRHLAVLEAIACQRPDVLVIVVSRAPDVSEWLDAIEAGATDYCAAPFEAAEIDWILESALRHRSPAMAFRAAG